MGGLVLTPQFYLYVLILKNHIAQILLERIFVAFSKNVLNRFSIVLIVLLSKYN